MKVQDGQLNKNWELKHIMIWKKEHDSLPKRKVVIFLDGEACSFDVDNLTAKSKTVKYHLNQNHLRYERIIERSGFHVWFD